MPPEADTTALDIATAFVAGYAALVASLAFAFQIFQWLRTWQTRVELEVQRMSLFDPGQASEPVVLFTLVNHSGHVVKVTHLGLDPIRRGGAHIFIPHPLPLPLRGRLSSPRGIRSRCTSSQSSSPRGTRAGRREPRSRHRTDAHSSQRRCGFRS